jgi:hypothetical protein
MAKSGEYGIRKLRKIAFGIESSAGTAVVASKIWRGTGSMKDNRVVTRPPEDVGYLVGLNRAYIPMTGGELTLDPTPATFEQFQTLLETGVKTVTPAADGGGTGYISTYPFPTTAALTTKTRTVESGDNQEMDVSTYAFTKEITLSGSGKEAVMMSAVMETRSPEPLVYTASVVFVNATKKITDAANGLAVFKTGMSIRVSGSVSNDGVYTVATGNVAGEIVVTETLPGESAVSATIEQVFTAAATLPTVEEMLFGNGKIYIDAVSGGAASTQLTKTWMGFTLKLKPGQEARYSGDGRLDFSFLSTPGSENSVELILEWNGSAATERRYAKLKTARKIRMIFEGSTFATAGTTYSKKALIFDGCGTWDTFTTLEEQDGDDIVKGNFVFGYDSSTTVPYLQAIVVNALSTPL